MNDTTCRLAGLGEVARVLGIASWRIRHALMAGHVADVPQVAGRRLFDKAAMDRLRDHFGLRGEPARLPGDGG